MSNTIIFELKSSKKTRRTCKLSSHYLREKYYFSLKRKRIVKHADTGSKSSKDSQVFFPKIMGLLTSESRSKLLLKNDIPSTAVFLWQLKKKVVFVHIWSGTKSNQFPVLVQVKKSTMWYPNLALLLVHTIS